MTAGSLLCVLFLSVASQRASSTALSGSKPSVELHASRTTIIYPCPSDSYSASRSCPLTIDLRIPLVATSKGFDKDFVYSYSGIAGQIVGEGSKVVWDLSGAWSGIYIATVEVRDRKNHRAESSVTVTIGLCQDCIFIEILCPTIVATCYDAVKAGTPVTCKVAVMASTRWAPTACAWSARDSDDNDLSASINRQGEYVSIPTKGLGGKAVLRDRKMSQRPSLPRSEDSAGRNSPTAWRCESIGLRRGHQRNSTRSYVRLKFCAP